VSIAFAGPSIRDQAILLANSLPQHFSQAQITYTRFQHFLDQINISPAVKAQIQANLNQLSSAFGLFISNFVKQLGIFLLNLLSWLFYIFTAFLISIFILARVETIKAQFLLHFPLPYRNDIKNLIQEMHEIFGGFLKGSIILSLINGIFTFIALSIYGFFTQPFQYNLTASLIAGLTYAIPIVGILISSLLGGLLAFAQVQNLSYALLIFAIMFGINKIVDQFVVPKVMSEAMGVSPLFIIFAAFAGGECLGFLGMILGVPLAAMVKTIWIYVYKNILTEKTKESNPLTEGKYNNP
jgi:predicted PurR-regulated permease PerM